MTQRMISPSRRRLKEHTLNSTLAQWEEKLQASPPQNLRSMEPEVRDAYLRLRWVLRLLRHRLSKTEPFLVRSSILKSLDARLSSLQERWQHFCNDPTQHWDELNNTTEAIVSDLLGIPNSSGESPWQETFETVSAEATQAIDIAHEKVKSLENQAANTAESFKSIEKQLKDLAAEIQSQQGRLDQALVQHTEAFTKAEQERSAQFTNSEQQRAGELSKSLERQRSQFDQLVTECQDEWSSRREEVEKSINQFNASTAKQAEELLAHINDQLNKAVTVVGTIVKTTMSGNYQVIANREYRNAWFMRGIALLSFIAMVGIIAWAVASIQLNENGTNWVVFALRISVGLALIVPGIYCARESTKHWLAEKHNRRIALELAALDPFLVTLDESKRKEIMERMADEYFGNKAAYSDAEEALFSFKDFKMAGDHFVTLCERLAKLIRSK